MLRTGCGPRRAKFDISLLFAVKVLIPIVILLVVAVPASGSTEEARAVFGGMAGGVSVALAAGGETSAGSGASFSVPMMLMHLFGGLALFLFGMEQMAGGLKSAAGNKMKEILAHLYFHKARRADGASEK